MTKKKEKSEQVKITLQETIHVQLTDDERAQCAKVASELQGDLEKKEFNLKLASENAKKEIKQVKAKMIEAATAHNSGRQYQSVKCQRVYCLKTKDTWLSYKNVEYQRRKMTAEELSKGQKSLFKDTDLNPKQAKVAQPIKNADQLAKEVAQIGKDKEADTRLPPQLANGGKKQKRLKAVPNGEAPPPVATEPEREDPRKDLGYT